MTKVSSLWLLAVIAMVVNWATTGAFLYLHLDELLKPGDDQLESIAPPPRVWSFQTEEIDQLIKELKVERDKVVARDKEAVQLSARLAAERQELDQVRAELVAIREEINGRVTEIQLGELKNLKTLAQTYSSMNPAAVVSIFREMDPAMPVKILALMKADQVGSILDAMARMPQEEGKENMARRAAEISDKLRLLAPKKKETL